MSTTVRYTNDEEKQLDSTSIYEYSDGTVTVKTWKGEPPDAVSKGKEKPLELFGLGLLGVKKSEKTVTLWFHEEDSMTNYALVFSEEAPLENIITSIFFLPREAANAVDRISQVLAQALKKKPFFLYNTDAVSHTARNVAELLVHFAGQLRGRVPELYTISSFAIEEIRENSCLELFVYISGADDWINIGVTKTTGSVWIWMHCYKDKTVYLIVARDESELLDFLIGSEDGSRVAQKLASALSRQRAVTRDECEAGRKILDKIRMLFG